MKKIKAKEKENSKTKDLVLNHPESGRKQEIRLQSLSVTSTAPLHM
jgi:hypothetical protein